MRAWRPAAFLLLIATALVAGCAPRAAETSGTAQPIQRGPVRLTAAIQSEPAVLSDTVRQLGVGLAGVAELERLVTSGLTATDDQGDLRPQLAEQVPTTENGLWVLLPDGRMETRWTLRAGAQWHDGTPLTTTDLLFTAEVGRDRQLALFNDPVYDLIERFLAVDDRTLNVTWKRPYVKADRMFMGRPNLPMPKHLIEKAYLEDKTSVPNLSYWHEDFVGTGPFKLQSFVRGSHVSLVANDQYVLGRPKIDELEVKFIPSPTTMAANLLAGTIDVVLGRSLSLDQALAVRDQWRSGRIEIGDFSSVILIYVQFINPSPPIIGDVQFRCALVHAMNRLEMADSLQAGLAPVAHSFVNPGEPEYRDVQDSTVRYDYDPRRAAQILEGLGYRRTAEGTLRDSANQLLAVEIRTSAGDDQQEKSLFSAADYWQRLGMHVDQVLVTPQQAGGLEYRSTFPGFDVKRQPADLGLLDRLHSSKTPLPSNNFAGNNYSRYVNPEFDALIDQFLVTIPRRERNQVAAQIVRHSTEVLNVLTLYFQASPMLISDRLIPPPDGQRARPWNSYQWDVK